MNSRPISEALRWLMPGIIGLATALGCGNSAPAPRPNPPTATTIPSPPTGQQVPPIELPQPAQRLGTAVVVLVDTSPSMAQAVNDHAGRLRPKSELAREALQRIMEVTDVWHQQHADAPLYLGLISFAGACATTLPVGPFDAAQARAALANIRPPRDGTAIGIALEEGFQALYSTGCIRKHLVCITDGENTVGATPDLVARQLYSQTKGDVEIHFVAFDTAASQFAFLKDVNGSVVQAADGAELQARLIELYEQRILVEAMPTERE
ncbi:MAG: vWA domain-containing protein [Planctomycetales bacterium]